MSRQNDMFETAVTAHYDKAYRFALTLTRNEADARDLTQSAFERLIQKADQLRDPAKVKTWLFTTLYRFFLERKRHEDRFPHVTVEGVDLPIEENQSGTQLDAEEVMKALGKIDDPFRAPLVLFYLEDHSYRDIAEVLNLPIGTVMSRLSRGKAMLRELLEEPANKVIPIPIKAAS